jgi:hypothetical protein
MNHENHETHQRGDLAPLVGCALLWHGQQVERIGHRDISLMVLAPTVNEAARDELQLLGCRLDEHEPGILLMTGLPFAAWFADLARILRCNTKTRSTWARWKRN